MAKNKNNMGKRVCAIITGIALSIATITAPLATIEVHALTPNSRQISKNDFLKAEGGYLKNQSNQVVALRGVNAGGWLLQESWMSPVNGEDRAWANLDTINTLKQRGFTDQQIQTAFDTYQDNWFTTIDLDNLQAMGVNCVRVPFWYRNFMSDEKGTWITGDNLDNNPGIKRLDWVIEECGKRGMYVILDCHGAPGGQSMDHCCGTLCKNELYDSAENRAILKDLWTKIAARYKDNPVVAAYDILNEPQNNGGYSGANAWAPGSDEALSRTYSVYDEMYKAIRAVDPNHVISMEAIWTGDCLPDPESYGWSNLLYQMHIYDTSKDMIDTRVNELKYYQSEYGVAVYAGEFNCDPNEEYAMNKFNEAGISWTTWAYKGAKQGVGNNWFLYVKNIPYVDANTDSYETILNKWGSILKTSNFDVNESTVKTWIMNHVNDAVADQETVIPVTPTEVPGKLEAENYLRMSGIQTETASDDGGGYNIGWIETNDWVDYKVNVKESGTYTVYVRVASENGSENGIQIKNGDKTLCTLTVPNTGGWQNWETISGTIQLEQGTQTLRLYAGNSDYNVNWMEFAKGNTTSQPVKKEIVFHDFESSVDCNASGSLTTDEKHSGEQGFMYSKTGDYAEWNVEIHGMDGTVDITDMDYITFWVKESGSNNLAVKLIDENQAATEVWTEMNAVAGEWTLMSIPLSSYDFEGVDKSKISKIAFYEWNEGTYYIDDIVFTGEQTKEEAKAPVCDGEGVWFQTFENETEQTYEASATGVTAEVASAGCEAEGAATKGLVYEKAESASPEIEDGSVLIKSATPVDVSGLRYLIFYIKDTNGSNTLKVSLIDAQGKETDFGASGWSELKTEKDNWKQYYVPISERVGTIDLTQVTGVRIGEWNQGTYYIDNVYFDNYLYAGEPVSKDDLPKVSEGEIAVTVEPGKYTEAQQVELIAEPGAVIYYTLENNTTSEEEKENPTTESERYKGALDITTTTTIKAISVKEDDAADKEYVVNEFTYEIVPYPVKATSEPGEYVDQVVVEFRTNNIGDLIYYTTDGSIPDRTNTETTKKYVKPMLITESVSFNAVAYNVNSGSATDVSSLNYVIVDSGKTPVPVFSKPAGTYGDTIEVEIKSDLEVHYTTDGSEPTKDSALYKEPIIVEKDMKIRAIAIENEVASAVAEAEYLLESEDTPFLKTDGEVIKDHYGTGDTIILRGTNAGGWLVTENWQCPITSPDQLTTINVFTERFGAKTAQELIELYQDNWWTEEDFDLVKEEGMNVLRLPITHFEMLNEDGSLKETAFERLDWFVQNCEERGLYVLIDMHGAVGSQNGKDHSGDVSIPDVGNFYGNEENIAKTIELWKAIAERYKDNPWVCGYDLLNEPSAVGTPQFEVYDRIYDAIREIDKNHIIFIQAIWEPNHLPDPSIYGWENVVYQYHLYGWHVEKDADGQKEFIKSKIDMLKEVAHGVPVLIGEFSFFSNEESWDAVEIFEQNGWNYTSWTFKVTDGGEGSSWGLYTSGTSKVDVDKDDLDVIKEKWAADKLNTSSFTRNDKYADVLKGYFANNAKNKPGTEAATGIEAKTTLALITDEAKSLEAKNVPENTTYKALSYASSNGAIAEVDAEGVVTAKAEGTAIITVTNLYGMTKECTVTVSANALEDGTETGSGTGTGTGTETGSGTGTETSTGTGVGTGTHTHTHTWSTEYTIIKDATAIETGLKGQKCTECEEYNPDTQKVMPKYTVKLNAKSAPLQVKKSTTAIKATVMEGDKVVKWETSNNKIATVSKTGKIKAGKKTGTAKITVTTEKGAKASINIKVQKGEVTTKSISVMNVSKKKLALKKGAKFTLETKLLPITSPEKMKFESSRKSIVTVTKKGELKAKKKGQAKITVSSGKKKTVITVTVK